MGKKKISESEDKTEPIEIKQAENKENTESSAENENNIQQPGESGTMEGAVAGEAVEVPVADKNIPDIREYEEKLAEMQDKYLRLSAEFDNYRRRTLKEKMDISKYAGEEILVNILPFMDDFERALKHIEPTPENAPLKAGIDLIYNKLSEFLKQQGLSEIEALNIAFNVDLHDAVATVPVNEDERKGRIIEVVSKGYYLKDKVIRHSKVVIGE
jgi:molecular chaperone GrpE